MRASGVLGGLIVWVFSVVSVDCGCDGEEVDGTVDVPVNVDVDVEGAGSERCCIIVLLTAYLYCRASEGVSS